MADASFWQGKRVFVTGHTGFKGAWLCLWLHAMGAQVTGYGLKPPSDPSLYELAGVESLVTSIIGDVRHGRKLQAVVADANPDIVLHLAAQPLVRESYRYAALTYETNVMGTVYLFEAVREAVKRGIGIRAVVNVTTDKVYDNREWAWGYREIDPLGGYDPYSNSKSCADLVTTSYQKSFFPEASYAEHGVAVASARAGNVIGGGDWASDRLVPDCIRALLADEPIRLRNPHAVRPWQHVLEPLEGYLLLAQRLAEQGPAFGGGWNFGPENSDCVAVERVVGELTRVWGAEAAYVKDRARNPHEAHELRLDCSKAKRELDWAPRWNLETAVRKVAEWAQAYRAGEDIRLVSLRQIGQFETTDSSQGGQSHD